MSIKELRHDRDEHGSERHYRRALRRQLRYVLSHTDLYEEHSRFYQHVSSEEN